MKIQGIEPFLLLFCIVVLTPSRTMHQEFCESGFPNPIHSCASFFGLESIDWDYKTKDNIF